jgi:hypothetical protein
MPRRAIGDRPLTSAERQVHQCFKIREEREMLIEALRSITAADYVTEAREIAAIALHRARNIP